MPHTGPGQAMLAHHRHDVGMVVLHLRERQAVHAALIVGPFRREVLGMQVAGQAAGLDLEQRLVTVLRLEPRVVGLRVLHVADVLRHERLASRVSVNVFFCSGPTARIAEDERMFHVKLLRRRARAATEESEEARTRERGGGTEAPLPRCPHW